MKNPLKQNNWVILGIVVVLVCFVVVYELSKTLYCLLINILYPKIRAYTVTIYFNMLNCNPCIIILIVLLDCCQYAAPIAAFQPSLC